MPTRAKCASDNLVLATGILSAPQFHGRRTLLRHSWLQWPNVGRSAPICAAFVVRAGGLASADAAALAREATVHSDMLRIRSIAHNESRIRGPVP